MATIVYSSTCKFTLPPCLIGTFSRLGCNMFRKYLHRSPELCLDDFVVYCNIDKHAQPLHECMAIGISINIANSIF